MLDDTYPLLPTFSVPLRIQMPPPLTHAYLSPKEVIEDYYRRHSLEDVDDLLDESPQLSHILCYESARRSRILLNERTVEARGKEMGELLAHFDIEQLAKKKKKKEKKKKKKKKEEKKKEKQLNEPGRSSISIAEMYQIIEELQLDLAPGMPESIITDSQLVTPRTVAGEKSKVSVLLTCGLEGPLGQGEKASKSMMRFRERAKAGFIAEGWTEIDFDQLVGGRMSGQLGTDGRSEIEMEMLKKLLAMAMEEQIDFLPEVVEDGGSKPIKDSGCPFHMNRAYINRLSKKEGLAKGGGRGF